MKKVLALYLVWFSFQNLFWAQPIVEYWLQARMNGVYELENGNEVEFWGYGDNTPPNPGNKVFLPAPQLRFKVGDSAIVHFKNNSPEMHTIHFHGLDVDQANDGVGHTSQEIYPNQTFDYHFKCNNAGTFLYHCHVLTTLHLAMGMYGTVVVDPASGFGQLDTGLPSYSQEYTLLSSEFDLDWNNNPLSPGPFQLYEANYLMVNGKSGTQLLSGEHDVLGVTDTYMALRLANIGYGKTQFIFPQEVEAVMYMADGRVLPTPVFSNAFELYPGERFDILIKSQVPLDTFIQVAYFDLRNHNLLGQNLVPLKIGVNTISTEKIGYEVWPNPFEDQFTIESFNAAPVHYCILAIDGRIVQSGMLLPGINKITTSFRSGIYSLKIGANGNLRTLLKQ
jgi:plastocyanin